MRYKKTFRPAIAMIELIFAIVIMAIVLMSAPMLMSTASQSGYSTMQQEGINEAASQVNIIMGYPWDEMNAIPGQTPTILNTTPTNINLAPTLSIAAGLPPTRRAGTPASSKRLFIETTGSSYAATSLVNLGVDGAELVNNDMDDFNNAVNLIELGVTTSDNIQKTVAINITRAVNYNRDITVSYDVAALGFAPFQALLAGSVSGNIKEIQVTVASAPGQPVELDKTITLRAFSSNIGSFKLEERL